MKSIKRTIGLILVFAIVIASSVGTGASSLDQNDSSKVLTREYIMANRIDVKVDVKAWEEVVIYAKGNTDAYEYPVRGGSEEWKALKTYQNRMEACQIPESKLESMSTQGLVITVLNYPLLFDIYAFDTPEQGLQVLASRFNGLQELMKRQDSGVELLAVYHSMNPLSSKEKWTDTQKGALDINFRTIETLLSHKSILDSFNKNDLEKLVDEAMKKYELRLKLNKSKSNQISSLNIIKKATNSEMMALGWPYNTSSVRTPVGTVVPTKNYIDDFSDTEKKAYRDSIELNHPEAIIIGEATMRYNCHSYAWYSQNTETNDEWMEDPSAYWIDGSYNYVGVQPFALSGGEKAYYDIPGNEHSAIVDFVQSPYDYNNLWVTSKWGGECLVYHKANDCRFYDDSITIKFYD